MFLKIKKPAVVSIAAATSLLTLLSELSPVETRPVPNPPSVRHACNSTNHHDFMDVCDTNLGLVVMIGLVAVVGLSAAGYCTYQYLRKKCAKPEALSSEGEYHPMQGDPTSVATLT